MKKTFTISLGHSVFNVEEDAYDILKMYLDSIKNYFQKMENDSEIISDFELRIAENFSSKLSSGKQYINLSDVKEVIQIMGSLDDFQEIYDDDDQTEDVKEEKKENNKLYRDSSNRIIAGVCSGIAEYFKIDPEDVIVFHDDLDVEFGKIKAKFGGSSAGHNGIASIDKFIGKDYSRIRIGIGKPQDKIEIADYVLQNFNEDEAEGIEKITKSILDSISLLIDKKLDLFSSTVNNN